MIFLKNYQENNFFLKIAFGIVTHFLLAVVPVVSLRVAVADGEAKICGLFNGQRYEISANGQPDRLSWVPVPTTSKVSSPPAPNPLESCTVENLHTVSARPGIPTNRHKQNQPSGSLFLLSSTPLCIEFYASKDAN